MSQAKIDVNWLTFLAICAMVLGTLVYWLWPQVMIAWYTLTQKYNF